MARIIDLRKLHALPHSQVREWGYNAVDTLATREIADVLLPRLDPVDARTYAFERAVQGPAMTMTKRGILVDTDARDDSVKVLRKELRAQERALAKMPLVVNNWDGVEKETGECPKSKRKDGKHSWQPGVPDAPERICTMCGRSRYKSSPLNVNSPPQIKHLLYDILHIKRQFDKDGAVTTDEEALERIGRRWPKYKELTDAILAVKGLRKQIGFLNSRLTYDKRFKSTFSVGTAWTGRWSASKDAFGFGGNSQNIAERHRHIFIADPGYELCYADLKQAESNVVAHLSGDEGYIEAHASGDVHTYVTRLVWPDLPWTGDLALDKAIAKQLPDWDPVPGHDFRFQAKRIQHGSNYGLSPFGIAIIAHIPVEAAQRAQRAYFRAFPNIPLWQQSIAALVRDRQPLYNPLGIRVKLFGKPDREHTYKQGLAFPAQSAVAHIINIAVWQLWMELDPTDLLLLAQIHDAILWEHRIEDRDRVLKLAAPLMRIPVPIKDFRGTTRTAIIETEAAVGHNWGHKNASNPDGLVEVHF